MAGVRFADSEHKESLEKFGYCTFRVTKEQREQGNHPDIGEVIHLLLDDTGSGRRYAVRLVADQREPDGGCTSIYMAAVATFT